LPSFSDIDREREKGKPIPSDHAPLITDFDRPGHPFDAGEIWADSRITSRLPKQPR
jgi:exodeoxyribonuclease-3